MKKKEKHSEHDMEKDAGFQEYLKEKQLSKFQGLRTESIDGEGWMIGKVRTVESEYEQYKGEQEKANKSSIRKQK